MTVLVSMEEPGTDTNSASILVTRFLFFEILALTDHCQSFVLIRLATRSNSTPLLMILAKFTLVEPAPILGDRVRS